MPLACLHARVVTVFGSSIAKTCQAHIQCVSRPSSEKPAWAGVAVRSASMIHCHTVHLQPTHVRWKRGHSHATEEGSSQGNEADADRLELSSSEEDNEDVISEAGSNEQPSGAGQAEQDGRRHCSDAW